MTSENRASPEVFWQPSNRSWESRLIDLAIDDDGGGDALVDLLNRMPVITSPGLEFRALKVLETCRINGSPVVAPSLREICSGSRQRKRDIRSRALSTLVNVVGESESLEEVLLASTDQDYRYVEFAAVLLEFFDDPRLSAHLSRWVRHQLLTKRSRSRSRFVACAFVALHRMSKNDSERKSDLHLQESLVTGMTDLERSAWRGAWIGHELTFPSIFWPEDVDPRGFLARLSR